MVPGMNTKALWLAVVALAIAACSAKRNEGSAVVGVDTKALSAADITRVTVTVTAADIAAPIVNDLALVTGQWKGVIGKIPAGTDRTFSAEAFDAQDTLLYSGEVTGVTITPGPPVLVYILLQQKDPPDPFQNSVPVIDSLVASAVAVPPGAAVSLVVTAHDPDPGDTLTYSWTAGSGSFDDAASTAPVWTAPSTEGPVTLTVTVTDTQASAQSLSVVIDVAQSHANGAANVQASLNTWPVITGLVADPAQVDVSETTSLTLTSTDADGDPLTYSWGDGGGDCAGSFSNSTAQSPTWTAPATAPPSGACTLSVTVADNRGGSTTGAITVQVGSAPSPNAAPVITNTFQSSAGVAPGAGVLFKVTATDPESQALTFAWSTATGTLATPTTTATTSEVTWTAPATGCTHTVTVAVSDTAGGTTSHDFAVTTCGTCGNGVIEGGEQCDGTTLGGASCASLGLGGGTLACQANCTFDTSGCSGQPADAYIEGPPPHDAGTPPAPDTSPDGGMPQTPDGYIEGPPPHDAGTPAPDTSPDGGMPQTPDGYIEGPPPHDAGTPAPDTTPDGGMPQTPDGGTPDV